MKITIFDNLFIFPHRAKVVSLETKNFLHFLLEDEYFQNEQKQLREKYGIPKDGYPLDKLYKAVEIIDEVPEGLSVEKMDEFHRFLYEIDSSDEVIFAPEDKAAVIDKNKVKLDTFYSSLNKTERLAFEVYLKKYKARKENNSKYSNHKEEFSIHAFMKQMENDLDRLATYYNLPSHFDTQFFLLIAFNALRDIRPQPFLFMTTNRMTIRDLLEAVPKSKEPIGALIVYEQVTKNQLTKWIENNWKILKDLMQELPKVSFPKSTMLDISKEIADLRDRKHKLFREIASDLTDKYPDDMRVTDETWVKETYRRYKNRLRAFTKNKQQ
ncbi:hypothetical protein HYU45_00770 [Candidatus Daviesbacteria bacterium]|nr:hypothetical protein [Candidatus Daviesbacteria bacterium]